MRRASSSVCSSNVNGLEFLLRIYKKLEKNIQKRVKKMFADGLLKEIENLKKRGVSKKILAEFGFEYNEPTEDKVILGTLQYSKRQNTWFKRDTEIKWFEPSELEKIKTFVKKSL